MAWSPRRRGQFLVVVGALLGALSGVVLGLAVDNPQTPTAVAAPGRAGGAALAAHPPSSQPSTSESTGSGIEPMAMAPPADSAPSRRTDPATGVVTLAWTASVARPSKDKQGKGKNN